MLDVEHWAETDQLQFEGEPTEGTGSGVNERDGIGQGTNGLIRLELEQVRLVKWVEMMHWTHLVSI